MKSQMTMLAKGATLWKISSEYSICAPVDHSGTKFQIFPSAVTQTFLGFLKQLMCLLKNQYEKNNSRVVCFFAIFDVKKVS